MIRTGTTRFWDMYWHPEATARAVADAGLRATIGAPLFDDGRDAEADARARRCESLERRSPSSAAAIAPALAPHSIYTVSEESLRWIAELSGRARRCRSRSTSPRPSPRSRTASPRTACAPPPTSTGSGC